MHSEAEFGKKLTWRAVDIFVGVLSLGLATGGVNFGFLRVFLGTTEVTLDSER